jgi:cytochrome oxidase Cu insertion factor (SCO1/SenC/PrrC family)
MTKRIVSCLSAVVLCAVAATATQAQNADAGKMSEKAKIDQPVKDFTLTVLNSDKPSTVKLSDFKGKQPVVLVWMSYTCPVTRAYEERLGKMVQEHGKDVAFIAVHADTDETSERIKRYAADKNFTGLVVDDKSNAPAGLTEYFGARSTPTLVVIDKNGIFRYKGRQDSDQRDLRGENPETKKYAALAITALKEGKEVVDKLTPTPG